MVKKIKVYFSKTYLPRWIVLFFDLFIISQTYLIAYLLRFNLNFTQTGLYLDPAQLLIIIPVFLFCFALLKTYAGVIRHSTTEDIARIVFALSLGSVILVVISWFMRGFMPESTLIIPYSVIIIQFAIASNILFASRMLTKAVHNEWWKNRAGTTLVMIYGAGNLGMLTRNALLTDTARNVHIAGFIDDTPSLCNKRSAGIPIYSVEQAFQKIIPRKRVSEIIIATDGENMDTKLKKEVINRCLNLNLMVKEVPSVNKWINGEFKTSEIKKINIEDLLGRDSIQLNREKITDGLKDAVILIAGAAGSIGSEIVKQLITFNAHHVVLLDKAESDLYDLQNDIKRRFAAPRFTVIVGDVTNLKTLRRVFENHMPDIVINAAAYKHVPLMEEYPNEAIRVNVGGTRNLADLSIEFEVKKFVFISTDKAVNPTNVMGTTKRISELYIQSLAQKGNMKTQFITTRFGNVLGSNGSVVPLFKKQIEVGGPVTVTHRDITRFFMTIPEACQLVLEACFMGNGGEIFIFDMGEPVKIYDLAEKMITLSGLTPHRDIKIEVTGLRPGEKLYEELLKNQEGLLPTHNDKILIGKVMKHDFNRVQKNIEFMLHSVDDLDNQSLVYFMNTMVPEFVSKNSYYDVKPAEKVATHALV